MVIDLVMVLLRSIWKKENADKFNVGFFILDKKVRKLYKIKLRKNIKN